MLFRSAAASVAASAALTAAALAAAATASNVATATIANSTATTARPRGSPTPRAGARLQRALHVQLKIVAAKVHVAPSVRGLLALLRAAVGATAVSAAASGDLSRGSLP